jgi:hypothetical protein
MNTVRPPNLGRVLEFKCAPFQDVEQRIDPGQQEVAGVAQQQRVGGIDHIG